MTADLPYMSMGMSAHPALACTSHQLVFTLHQRGCNLHGPYLNAPSELDPVQVLLLLALCWLHGPGACLDGVGVCRAGVRCRAWGTGATGVLYMMLPRPSPPETRSAQSHCMCRGVDMLACRLCRCPCAEMRACLGMSA